MQNNMIQLRFENPLMQNIYNLVWKHNKNVLIVIVGGTGTGKSYLAMRLLEMLDPTFNYEVLEQRLSMNPQEFLHFIEKKAEEKLQKGMGIIFDEAGVGLSNKEWQSKNNRIINKVLQTFRNRNLFVIFTVPVLTYIDSGARKLFHYSFEPKRINREFRKVNVKIFNLQTNSITGDVYTKYPVVAYNGVTAQLNRIVFSRPNIKLCHKYEKMVAPMKAGVVSTGRESLLSGDKKILKQQEDINLDKEIVKNIVENYKKFIHRWNGEDVILIPRIMNSFDNLTLYKSKIIKLKAERQLKLDGKI